MKKFGELINENKISDNIETLDKLKSNISDLIQKYIQMNKSTLDLDKMDREVITEKLEKLKTDIDKRLEELKSNIWVEK